MKREIKNKLIIISVVLTPILVGVISFFVYLFFFTHPKLIITNLSSYTTDKPRSEEVEKSIQEYLYDVAKLNKEDVSPHAKAVIRDNTFLQREKWKVNYVEFIVDIEVLEESFKVSYSWTDNKDAKVNDQDTYITCVDEEDKIYNSPCTDFRLEDYGTNDPLDFILPHHEVEKFFISYNNKNKEIIVNLYGCREETIIDQQKLADAWLKENIYHLDKYKVKYNTCAD